MAIGSCFHFTVPLYLTERNQPRHVDSAQMYRNEEAVGKAVKESGLKREDLFIKVTATKKHWLVWTNLLQSSDLKSQLATYLLDYVDLFLIHDPLSGPKKRLETYQALLECRDKGKIKSVGVSNFGVKHLEQLREAGFETPAINQIEQKDIVAYCKEHKIVVQAYCPLVRGVKWEDPILKGLSEKSTHEERIASNADVYGFELSAQDMTSLDALDQGSKGAVSWNPVNAD
ncbi:hypothetical protein FRC10_003523 [Ceratobasidium sp. 414]|nr:hypothetical protein FRC10_003523 [Ceratobasidium sp. 414]